MKRCLVAVCHNGPVVLTETTQSLIALGWGNRVEMAKQAHGFDSIDFTWEAGLPRVDSLRDAVLEKALRHKYTHVLFLDADMAWPSDLLLKMLAFHDKGIVSGLYCLKSGTFAPVALKDPSPAPDGSMSLYQYDIDYREDGQTDADGLRDVDVVGMGCTLIPLSAVRAIGSRPWFYYENDAEGWPRVSEDVPFCRNAKAAGVRIAWAPGVKCDHAKVHYISEPWHISAMDGALHALAGMVKQ